MQETIDKLQAENERLIIELHQLQSANVQDFEALLAQHEQDLEAVQIQHEKAMQAAQTHHQNVMEAVLADHIRDMATKHDNYKFELDKI